MLRGQLAPLTADSETSVGLNAYQPKLSARCAKMRAQALGIACGGPGESWTTPHALCRARCQVSSAPAAELWVILELSRDADRVHIFTWVPLREPGPRRFPPEGGRMGPLPPQPTWLQAFGAPFGLRRLKPLAAGTRLGGDPSLVWTAPNAPSATLVESRPSALTRAHTRLTRM